MTPIEKQLSRHRSIRKYKPRKIPETVLKRILSAGTMASSSGNMQAYSIIVTRDSKFKKKMLKAHFNQSMVTEAPALITFCADFYRMRKWLEMSGAPESFDNFMSFMIAAIDAVLASQNVAIAAESEGLGICYMGTTLASCREIAEILNCPSHVVPVVGFSIGFPDESPAKRMRLPLEAVVHHETYQRPLAKNLLDNYSVKEREGMKRYRKDPKLRAALREFGAVNLAQVYTKIKYTRDSHIQYSEKVLQCLRERGFI